MSIGKRENGVAEDVDPKGQNLLSRETRVGQRLKRRRRGGGGCLGVCSPAHQSPPPPCRLSALFSFIRPGHEGSQESKFGGCCSDLFLSHFVLKKAIL